MAKRKQSEDYAAALASEFERWEHIYKKGCSDPIWPDGVNLELLHNHILYYKRMIEETMPEAKYPEIYYRDAPPEVDRNYMARSDEIREHAKASLAAYLADPDFRFICRKIEGLNPKDEKKLFVRNVIGYAAGLEKAIREDDLVTMRRHERAEGYLSSFASCAERIRELQSRGNTQLSLFDLSDEDENCDDLERGDND
ncbi:MAG: hypothetical protein LBK41_00505 [Clostridiales bacterium]|jgi:hypothetical protein|nr:hypothetical protein [Clostridiales bacterium]